MAKRYARRGKGRGKATFMSVAKKALRVAYRVAKLAIPELKFLDTVSSLGQTLPQLDGAVYNRTVITDQVTVGENEHLILALNDIAEGTDESERVGRECNMRAVDVRIATKLATSSGLVRHAIIEDRQPSSVLPATIDIFEPDGGTTAGVTSHLNLNNSKRFRILKDRVFKMDADSYGDDYAQYYVSAQSKKAVFDGSSAAIPESGYAYYLVILTNRGTGGFTFSLNNRVRFSG